MTSGARAAAAGGVGSDLDDLFVLRARPLRPGVVLASTARFGDDSWPLGPAVLQNHCPQWVLNFTAIPAGYRQAAKELCDCLLSADLPAGESRRQISSIRSMFSEFKRFLLWLDARQHATGRAATLTVTATDLGEYARHLLTAVPASERRRFSFSCTRYFWRYRQVLTTDRFGIDPQWRQRVDRTAPPATGEPHRPDPRAGPRPARRLVDAVRDRLRRRHPRGRPGVERPPRQHRRRPEAGHR